MSKRVYELFLFDIYIAISKIKFVSSKFNSANDLLTDFISWDSVIREFEILGEASRILIENNLIEQKYRIVVDFRNKIVHHYFGIDSEAVWSIIKEDLPGLESYIKNKILSIDKELFSKLYSSALEDNKNHPQIHSAILDLSAN